MNLYVVYYYEILAHRFSIWNTMMGTSLLSMPWAVSQAGFGLGLALMVIMAGITLYTSYRVMKSVDTIREYLYPSVPDINPTIL